MEKTFYLNSNFETKRLGKSAGLKIAGYANTTDKDRVGDVVTAKAWAKGVENYRKNPVLLYQHKHDQPIGKVDKVTVDRKGIYVDAIVSEAAEKLHGVQTLIKDGALKSFSVGFRVKDGNYDEKTDSMTITDVELLEISVVSVPANQNSLFSIRKSFDGDSDYENFVKNFKTEESEEEMDTEDTLVEEKSEAISETEVVETVETTETIEVEEKAEEGSSNEDLTEEEKATEAEESTEEIAEETKTVEKETTLELSDEEEELEETDPMEPIPFVNLLSAETSSLNTGSFVKYEGKRFKITKIATAESPNFKFLEVDVNGKSVDNIDTINAEEIAVVNTWDIDTKYDIHVINTKTPRLTDSIREQIKSNYSDSNTATEQYLFQLKNDENIAENYENQEKLNKILNLKSSGDDWSDSDYVFANYLNSMISELKKTNQNDQRDLALKLHGHAIIEEKEKDDMATQTAGDVLTIDTGATENKSAEAKAATIEVQEPRVAELVEKTGEAIMAEADAKDRQELVQEKAAYTPRESEAVAELKAQMEKYREEIAALQNSKMVFQESQRKENPYSEKEMANAVMLGYALGKRDPMDTSYGNRMKAIVQSGHGENFISNFSTNIYEEMQQQLVVAPMFQRLNVDAKTFRIPVADEDNGGTSSSSDDVAQFASGTYASGIADATNVPNSYQNKIKSVDLTPHKFMTSTHIAKDEEEDTILPLIDFLRASTTRRIARAIDKAILRGNGALSGFNANSDQSLTTGGTGFRSVISGITKLANAAALEQQTGSSSTKAAPAEIADARATLGKYGLQLGDQLVLITSVEGYNSLVAESDFRTVDKFGPNATYLTGALGAIYGIPVVISEFMDNVGTSWNVLASLVYKPGFVIGERRGMEIESEYEPRQQVTAMYMSTRFDFKAMTTAGTASSPTLSSTYSFACNISAG